VTDRSVTETGQNKLATFVARYSILEEFVDGAWADVSGEGLSIDGYHYLEKRDGAVNEFTIDALKEAFGWDGRDVYWLEDNDLPNCQITLKYETHEGRERMKIKWLNPYDSEGGMVSKATPEVRKKISGRLGSKLRAIAGTTPAAQRPTGTPKTPPRAAPKPAGPTATMEDAWAAFADTQAASATPISDEWISSEWFRIIAELTGKTDPAAVTPEEWYRVKTEGPAQVVPF
jgi:hypothetical protein